MVHLGGDDHRERRRFGDFTAPVIPVAVENLPAMGIGPGGIHPADPYEAGADAPGQPLDDHRRPGRVKRLGRRTGRRQGFREVSQNNGHFKTGLDHGHIRPMTVVDGSHPPDRSALAAARAVSGFALRVFGIVTAVDLGSRRQRTVARENLIALVEPSRLAHDMSRGALQRAQIAPRGDQQR
ncbi:MAG TPA: hypothetical protein VFX82_13670 [Desulfobacterales bacterium]|nr:hypothetical protein [Desulfobacterales bacterium]